MGAGFVGAEVASTVRKLGAEVTVLDIARVPLERVLGPEVGELLADRSACGDVASAWRPSVSRRVRVEHWTSAAGQAASVARAILGEERPYDDLPYFWSDQFGLRLQHVGHAEEWAGVEIEGDPDSFTARYLDGEGRTLAALLANRPREVAALRRELAGADLAAAA